MSQEKLKVAIVYNETNPELYIYKSELEKSNLKFIPYFEIEDRTPMDEFEDLRKHVENTGFETYCLNINDNLDILLKNIKEEKPDVIFNFVEIFKSNARLEMCIAGLFETLEIPFTGAPPLTLANCQNKVLTKRILAGEGIKTPEFQVFHHADEQKNDSLRFPLMVKPLYEDASVGIENKSVVYSPEALYEQINHIVVNYKQPALVEEFIEGRELNVAVFGYGTTQILPISEIDFSTMPDHLENIVSYQAKWDPTHESYHKTIPHCPAVLTKTQENNIKKIASRVFEIMELRDYARIDMRLRGENEYYVIEVNPNPDLSEGAGFMRSAEAAGYHFEDVLRMLIGFAYMRKNR